MEPEMLHTIAVWAGIGFVFLTLTMLAIMDVLRKEFGSAKVKAVWGFIALIPFVGWLVYLVLGFRKGALPTE
jgi:hypothetical protein